MNQKQMQRLRDEAFRQAVYAVEEWNVKSLYGAVVLVLHRKLGFDDKQCIDVLNEIDSVIVNYFTTREIIEDAWKEVGLRLNFKDGIERFESVEGGT